MTAVPTSKQWTARIDGPSGEIQVETHSMFGWNIQRHTLPAGSVLVVVALEDVARTSSPNITFHTKGVATCHVNDRRVVDREPGLFTPERPSYEKGRIKIEAVDDIEYWCINYVLNRRSLPVVTPIRLKAGEDVSLVAGELVFIMRGALDVSNVIGEYVPSEDVTATALEDTYAYIVQERKQ